MCAWSAGDRGGSRRKRGGAVRARAQRFGRARLLERVFDIDLQHCPRCGAGELEIIAAILERTAMQKILAQPGLDRQPPPLSEAREAGHEFAA